MDIAAIILAQLTQGSGWGTGPGPMHGYGWGMGLFGGIFMLILAVIAVVLIILLVKWAVPGVHPSEGETKRKDEAMDILRKRYASGEVTKEEFEERKKVLEG